MISSVDRPDLSHMFTTINGFSTGSPTNAKRDIISHLKSLAPNGSHPLFETAPSKISKRSLSSLGLNHALIDDIKTTDAIKVNYYSAHFPRNYFDNIDRNYSSYMNNSYSPLDATYTRQSINELGSGNAWTIRIHHAIPEGNFHDQLNEAERKHQIILKTISDNPASTHQDKLKSVVDDYASGWGFNKKAMWDEDNYHFRCDECLKIGGVEGEEDKAHDKGWMMDYGLMYCPNCFNNKICHDCWNPKLDTSFNQCKYCQGDDEEYKQSYSNGWGFNA